MISRYIDTPMGRVARPLSKIVEELQQKEVNVDRIPEILDLLLIMAWDIQSLEENE